MTPLEAIVAMRMTVEISMYPFQEKFRNPIKEFIGKLEQYEQLQITPGPTSTVIIGDYDEVMDCLREMLRWSHDSHGKAAFVTKMIPGYHPS